MTAERFFLFPPFQVDTLAGSLCRDAQELALRAKTFALLCYFLKRPGQLLSKDELLSALWPDTYVSEGVLTVCMAELRKVLGDDTRKPRFIATVPKRGYRFIAEVSSEEQRYEAEGKNQKPVPSEIKGGKMGAGDWGRENSSSPQAFGPRPQGPNFVGRNVDLARLHGLFAKACAGRRQLVFVTGEPGIGKTTLVEAFLRGARIWELESGAPPPQALAPESQLPNLGAWVARGQCIEHYGVGEAYLPILDALGQLCRDEGGEKVVKLLSRHAPTWLAQMPELLTSADLEAVQKRAAGATRERMLREMTGALETLTTEYPLILVLEDLHWSDYSTVDLVSFIARHQSPARLMIIGTYRPDDVLRREHPLLAAKQELLLHGQCEELPLTSLSREEVGEYLSQQFPGSRLADRLGAVVHQRTEGNPLFLVSVVHDFVEQGVIVRRNEQWELIGDIGKSIVPLGLRQFIERQFARVKPEERAVLEAASVAGMEFSVAAIAAALGGEALEIETVCETLARRGQFVQANGVSVWPDGTAAGRYRFSHALYQEALYERVSAGWRIRLHRQVGECVEAAYGNRVREVATELAVHFERGQDIQRAVQYLGQAGENAMRQNAHVEAINLLNHAIELLQTLPDTPERAQQELGLYLLLRTPLASTKGYVAPEIEHAYRRACELCRRVGQAPQLFMVLGGPYALHLLRSELPAAYRVAEERMQLTESLPFDLFLQVAHFSLGVPLLFMGDLARARTHLEQSVIRYKPDQLGALGHLYDPGVMSLSQLAFVLWLLGYPDQALQQSRAALALARELSHPFSLVYALGWATRIHRFRGEQQASKQLEEEWVSLCTEQGFSHQLALAAVSRGWGLMERGQVEKGIGEFRQGLTDYRTTGEELGVSSYLILLADAYGKTGRFTEGFNAFAEAEEFINKSEERFWEAELYRLAGELSLRISERETKRAGEDEKFADSPTRPFTLSSPDDSFLKAIAVAQGQQAKSLELRAVMSLARLRQHQAQGHATSPTLAEAHNRLAELYAWFTEGFDTRDLQEAKALLGMLSQGYAAEASPTEIAQHETSVPNLRLVVNKDNNAQRPPRMPVAKRGRR
jgi:DNA-binding winged helix-turn-helix (wHTH) protein/predicted ATPase